MRLMQTGVWDRSGELHARATKRNDLVVHEIDLAIPHFGVVILEIFTTVFVMNDLHFNFPNNKLKDL